MLIHSTNFKKLYLVKNRMQISIYLSTISCIQNKILVIENDKIV